MTIDERLEALTQTVELLSRMHIDNQKEQRIRNAHIDQLHTDMMMAIARLANTAEAHNGQLADHEERIDKLEDR